MTQILIILLDHNRQSISGNKKAACVGQTAFDKAF
jgi:hypothetical protein